jgi:choline dehydrogenase-like flavoprotein
MSVRALSEGAIESPSVCIIGAGMAGLIAARRLAQAGISVLVLESGGPGDITEPSALNAIDDVHRNYAGGVTGRYRGLGGTSQRWGGRMLPVTASEARERSYLGLDGWPFDIQELDVYRGEIERLFTLDSSSYEEQVLDEFALRGPLPRGDTDFAIRCPKWVAFSRCNVGQSWRAELERQPNLDVRLDATVVDFSFDPASERLISVTARDAAGHSVRVQAAEFLLAAGTIETTRLLLFMRMRSQGRAFADCRALGRYFQEHIGATVATLVPRTSAANDAFGYRFIRSTRRSIHLELKPTAQRDARVAGAFVHVIMSASANSSTDILRRALRGLQRGKMAVGPRDLTRLAADSANLMRGVYWRYVRSRHFWPADLRHTVNVWIEQLPNYANHIALSERCDAYGVPLARIEWQPTEADERTFQACIAHLQTYWKRHDLSRIGMLQWSSGVPEGTVPVNSIASALLHPSGSTRMGVDPRDSVVDRHLRCHAVRNLSIASASAFPTAGSANPTLTILEVAMRAADAIVGRLCRKPEVNLSKVV